jgi:hypothetical protein
VAFLILLVLCFLCFRRKQRLRRLQKKRTTPVNPSLPNPPSSSDTAEVHRSTIPFTMPGLYAGNTSSSPVAKHHPMSSLRSEPLDSVTHTLASSSTHAPTSPHSSPSSQVQQKQNFQSSNAGLLDEVRHLRERVAQLEYSSPAVESNLRDRQQEVVSSDDGISEAPPEYAE